MAEKKSKKIDSRTVRRRRRIRSVILSYFAMAVILVAIGAGIFFGVKKVANVISDKKAQIAAEQAAIAEAAQAQQEAQIQAELEAYENPPEEEVAEEEVVEEEYTEEDLLDEVVNSCISEMSIEDKVAGLFIISPEQLTGQDKVTKAGDGTKEAIETHPVGGIVYSSQNVKDADQLTEMLANTVSYSKYPIFLAASEGLGDESILRKTLKLDGYKSAEELGESGDSNLTYESYKSIGEYMTTYGFNLDFSPSADIIVDGVDNKSGGVSFGQDVMVAGNLVAASVEGLNDSGVTAAIKFFPGQGTADANTSEGMANITRTKDEFVNNEMSVFSAGISAGAKMIMVGHVKDAELTGDETLPCSMSKELMTETLRGEFQYNGVIITDSLSKKAITEYYSADDVAIKALKAGADMLLMPEDFELAYNAVVDAVKEGTISEQRINDSLARVYRIKYQSTIE